MNLAQLTGMPERVRNLGPHSYSYQSYMERSIERRQLDKAVELNDETATYLYTRFTPTTTDYPKGSRPLLEQAVEHVCRNCETGLDRALALVQWRRGNTRRVAKCGLGTEEEILLGGYSLCHDSSRCLITLLQVAGLGARMVVGLNEAKGGGHTLVEVYVGGRWMLLDPSPSIPYAFYQLPDGVYANARDIQLDPSIPSRCPRHNDADRSNEEIADHFTNCRLTNYTLEESTRNMAQRFVRMITAFKVLENYDYLGHVNHQPPASFVDLDGVADQWLQNTVCAHAPDHCRT